MKTSIRVQLVVLCAAVSLLAACSSGGNSDSGPTNPTTPNNPNPPADTTPPTVSSKSPAAGASNVPLNPVVSALFSEAMTNSTLTGATFTLAPSAGGPAVGGTIGVSGNTATLTPTASLAAATQYTATVTTGAQDAAGNGLAADVAWTFTTGAAADNTPPTVVSSNLTNGQAGASDTTRILAVFSEVMDPVTLSLATFTLTGPSGDVAGTVTYSDNAPPLSPSATFLPTTPLAGNTTYTANVTAGATDLAGNPLAPFSLTFTTFTPTLRAFTTAPALAGSAAGTVVLVNPADPAAAAPSFPSLVNTSTTNSDGPIQYLAAGTYDPVNKQVRDLHRHAVIFSNNGNIFRLSTVATGTAPVPVQISNVSGITAGLGDGSAGAAATDLCAVFAIPDFQDVDTSPIGIEQAGPDKICFSADDVIQLFPVNASPTTSPTAFPAGLNPNAVFLAGRDIATGAFNGFVAATSPGGTLVKLSGAGLPVTNSPAGVTSAEPVTELSDGKIVVRINNGIRVYDPVANSISAAAIVTLSQAQGFQFVSDGTNFFFTDNAAGGTRIIQKISFATTPPTVTPAFFTGAVGAQVNVNTLTPTGTGRLIFQENGTIKSILKSGGAVATLISPAGGPVIFVGVANGTPVKVYANVSTGGFTQGIPGSGTWAAKVANEDGSAPASHSGDSRWIAGSFASTVNLAGNQRFLRQTVLLTRAVGAADDQAASVVSFNALTHNQTAALGTVPADVAVLGDAPSNTSTFSAREEGGPKLLLRAIYTGASGKTPDVFFVDPLVDGSLVNVGTAASDARLDFSNVLD